MRERSIFIVGGAIVIGIVVLLFAVRPLYEDGKTQKQALVEKQGDLADLQTQVAGMKRLISEFGQVDETQKASLNKRFPAEVNTEALVSQIEGIARTTQVIVSNVQFTSNTKTSSRGYRELGLTMNLAGSYESIVNFLKSLESNDRLITVDSVNLVPGELGLAATLRAHTYYGAVDTLISSTSTSKTTQTDTTPTGEAKDQVQNELNQ